MQDLSLHLPPWPWDSMPGALWQVLATALADSLSPRAPVYLLVDPLLGDLETPIDKAAYPHHPIPGDALRLPADQLPYLIELKNPHDDLLAQSLHWAGDEHLRLCALGSGPSRIGGWLQPHAPHEGPALARQLAALFGASGAPGGGRYLRLADRRVLSLLHGAGDQLIVPPVDWTMALQGIAHWTYLDANFQLRTLAGNEGAPSTRPLPLGGAHWQLMSDAEAVNRSLMAWQGRRHPLPDDALAQARAALGRSRERGLRTPEDRAAYAVDALCYPTFEQWSELPGHIAVSLRAGQPLSERLDARRRGLRIDPDPRGLS